MPSGNANKNSSERQLTVWNGQIQNTDGTKSWQERGATGFSFIAGGNARMVQPL